MTDGRLSDHDQEALMRLFLMQHMPMHFNALVVERTSRCTAQCAMCYQAAGPRGSDALGDHTLAEADVARVIEDAVTIPNLHPRFHLTGGESFLDVNACMRLFERARDVGFLDLTSTTNAYWARDPGRALDICRRLRAAGVTSLEISWDVWHLPYIDARAVSQCLMACAEVGIESNLRLLASRSHDADEALDQLHPEALEQATRISCNPVFPTGRGAQTLDPTDLYTQGTLNDNCHTTLNLTVNARGNVSPCCAGLDQTDAYVFGNVTVDPVSVIAHRMNASPMLRTVVFGGIAALFPVLEAAGVPPQGTYTSICHACWSIFSDPVKVDALKTHFEEAPRRAVLAALAQLEAHSMGEPA
ncbi:radical SAM protein [Deinococcus aerophilus]|uniref:4Fe4S-binding SPASM domain-containing protein n=1 Tax=Deinococcus aerophilus TaxID=522488 RepID=A0ABQ2GYZ4_9DEIO|nr:radical SAM protein [Deinococcus aerophilus]GGM18376.1 hypothetical protein GCM10010841_28090 [Deinococcus aerophilus]